MSIIKINFILAINITYINKFYSKKNKIKLKFFYIKYFMT